MSSEKQYIPGRVVNKNLQSVEAGFVMLRSLPMAENIILQAARVSHGADGGDIPRITDESLIRFMWRNGHTSPFEHVSFTFIVSCPMFVKNQWMRHRTGKYNEISARYTQMDDHFWFPRSNDLRTQSSTNHQCSGTGTPSITNNELTNSGKSIAESYRCYENLLTAGVAREQARAILPLNIFTKFYFTMDLHNLLHFLELRLAPDAQPEIRYYAEAIVKIIKPMIPMTWKAFEDFTLNKITFTGPEVAAIKSLKLEAMLPTTNFATARERAEFIEKIKRLFVTV